MQRNFYCSLIQGACMILVLITMYFNKMNLVHFQFPPSMILTIHNKLYENIKNYKYTIHIYKYRPFHKTSPRSNAFVNWDSVRFYETDCIYISIQYIYTYIVHTYIHIIIYIYISMYLFYMQPCSLMNISCISTSAQNV